MTSTIYITFLEREGPYIKVWGQTDKIVPIGIEKALKQMTPSFELGQSAMTLEGYQNGLLCCAKFKDGSYYRARITNTIYINQGMVEVIFVDYGNRDFVPLSSLRTMTSFTASLISIPSQARDFILAGVTHTGVSWDDTVFELISNDLRYTDLDYQIVSQVANYTVITFTNEVINNILVKGYAIPVPIPLQQVMLQSIAAKLPREMIATKSLLPALKPEVQVQMPAAMPMTVNPTPAVQPQQEILNYKSIPLEHGSEHCVYVSYVTDGPLLFSVQLQKMEEKLKKLMMEINSIQLHPLDESPLPGTVCLARSSEDDYICRAVVTNMVDGQFKVFYVDFGNTEFLPYQKLYLIPFKYVIPKVMATRFALSGLINSVVSLDMKVAFKDFVDNKVLYMRVVPPEKGTAINLCELWDEKKTSALDYVRCSALQSYPDPVPLTRGFNQEVKVSFVYSCKRFYVQLKNKEEELNSLMKKLQEVCPNKPSMDTASIQEGMPCNALYDNDEMFYRAQILEVSNGSYKVRYIDYGNEENIPIQNIKQAEIDLITILRPQAIECCLSGYQNMNDDRERDNCLEEIILENDFSMKVVEIQGTKILVDLFDAQHYNVASLLLNKLAARHSQVSPALVQDNSKIEQRRRTPPEGYSKRSPRDSQEKSFGNKRDSWRDRDNRQTNHNEEKSDWREKKRRYPKQATLTYRSNNFRDDQPRDERNKRFDTRSNNSDRFEKNDNNWGQNNGDNFTENKHKPRSDNWSNPGNDDQASNDFRRKPRSDNYSNPANNDQASNDFRRKPRSDNWSNPPNEDHGSNDFRRKPRNESRPNDNFGSYSRESDSQQDFKRKPRNDRDGSSWGNQQNNKYSSQADYPQRKQREGSEKSWSGSEKSGNRFQNKGGNRSPNQKSYNNDDRQNLYRQKSNVTSEKIKIDSPATMYDEYIFEDLVGKTEDVSVSWFHNPSDFYCQLERLKSDFTTMMKDLQMQYKRVQWEDLAVGTPAVARFTEDNAFYRIKIVEKSQEYKIFFIDFGNYSTAKNVYPLDKKFLSTPVQAYHCCFEGLIASGENWPKTESFSKYFERDVYQAIFHSEEDKWFTVDLQHGGTNIKDSLIEDGLAILNQQITPQVDFDVNILLQQKLICELTAVNKLDDILLQIQPGLYISCALRNLENAKETNVVNLNSNLGTFIMAYVDEVSNNRAIVTLYDNTGEKLDVVSPDEPVFERLLPALPHPVFLKSVTGYIVFANETSIFMQPVDTSETIATQLDTLFEYYDAKTEIPNEVTNDTLYAVKSSDGNWYRGKLVSTEGNQYNMKFIDYGNTEIVDISALRELDPIHFQPHELCIEIIYPNGASVLEQEITLQLRKEDHNWVVAEPMESSKVQESEVATLQQTEPESVMNTQEEPTAVSNQCGFSVHLSHLDNPGQFYLQLSEALVEIDELQDRLQLEINDLPTIENITTGILCAAPYSADQLWYRAQVLDGDSDITTVRFIDFGNTDVLDNQTCKVKSLPPELLTLQHHSKRCSLYLQPIDAEWNTEACEKFEQLIGNNALTAEIVHQDEKTTYVELYAEGLNIGQELLKANMAGELLLETSTSCTGYVSNLNSPSEFWIQLESACNDLEWVSEQLTNAEGYAQLQDLEPGSLCAAVFPDDDNWYRARILSNTVAGLEVLFIDYGNSCTCSSLRELPEDLVMLQPLAQKCSLQKPAGLLQWPVNATDIFKDISADGITIFTVNRISQGETSEVQLVLDNIDISNKLLPSTFKGVIDNYSSINDFTIKKEDQSLMEHCLLDVLPGHVWADNVEEKMKEIISKDPTFDVELVTTNSLRLYLDFTDIRLQLPLIKSTPASSVQSSPKKSITTKTDVPDTKPQEDINASEDIKVDDHEQEVILNVVESEPQESVVSEQIKIEPEASVATHNTIATELNSEEEKVTENHVEDDTIEAQAALPSEESNPEVIIDTTESENHVEETTDTDTIEPQSALPSDESKSIELHTEVIKDTIDREKPIEPQTTFPVKLDTEITVNIIEKEKMTQKVVEAINTIKPDEIKIVKRTENESGDVKAVITENTVIKPTEEAINNIMTEIISNASEPECNKNIDLTKSPTSAAINIVNELIDNVYKTKAISPSEKDEGEELTDSVTTTLKVNGNESEILSLDKKKELVLHSGAEETDGVKPDSIKAVDEKL